MDYRWGRAREIWPDEQCEMPKVSPASSLKQVVSLMEDLEEKKQIVATKEQELAKAKEIMAKSAENLQAKISSLDSSAKDLIRDMLGQDADTRGKIR